MERKYLVWPFAPTTNQPSCYIKANIETPCPDSPDQPLPKPKASPSTNISIAFLQDTPHRTSSPKTNLCSRASAFSQSSQQRSTPSLSLILVSVQIYSLKSLPASLVLNHRTSHDSHRRRTLTRWASFGATKGRFWFSEPDSQAIGFR